MIAEWGPESGPAEHPPRPVDVGPMPPGPAHTMMVSVPDADATFDRAVAAGARVERALANERYGRTGVVIDPFGYRWMVNTRPRSATQARPGDMVYLTVYARDEGALRTFYGNVLGHRVLEQETTPTVAIAGAGSGDDAPGQVPVYRVPDVMAALARVREAGGQAGVPEHEPWGLIASVTDPEGNRFAVWQPPQS
jgi:predicted enzyme related to lactoylglutathione lyase